VLPHKKCATVIQGLLLNKFCVVHILIFLVVTLLLCFYQEDAGGGLVFWHPKGAIIRHVLEDSWKQIHMQHGYDLLYTPHVAKADLWKISGHIDFYRENMYNQMDVEDELYQLRPMNCPYHILVYKRKLHSYRDFPIRVAELGTVYRYELSGSLHGLFRVRGFTQVLSFFRFP
jgi:threonyl-tRNA synthetase